MDNDRKRTFERIYAQHRDMVAKMCLGYMKGDLALAEDLEQDVFINVWNALDRFRNEASFKTWLYRITVNTCLQHIRKRDNKPSSALPEEGPIAEATPDEGEERKTRLYKAIGQLKEVERLIIMMVLDGEEYATIANVLGTNEGNLRVRIHRIKNNLKKHMNKLVSHE
ncbi:RNA polymerase sigma factor [Fulvitalea axinellae]